MKQRFPTLDHVVDTGFMTKNEKKLFEAVPANEFNTYWVPCTWFIFRLNLFRMNHHRYASVSSFELHISGSKKQQRRGNC